MRSRSPRSVSASGQQVGYTLLELLVVLVLMGLAAALVIPALRSPTTDADAVNAVLLHARSEAAQRGEAVYLTFEPTGAWRMSGGSTPAGHDLDHGRVAPIAIRSVMIIVGPLGSCAVDPSTADAVPAASLDALTCEWRKGGR